MKILYITNGEKVDYLSDCVFHGLYTLFGDDVVDCNRIWYMWERDSELLSKFRGKGFTITGLLNRDTTDREDIERKIVNRYFDWVFFGSIHRSKQHLDLVLNHYPRNRIVAFDGEDHGIIASINVPYFKRELYSEDPDIFPISFAIPECKIRNSLPTEKSQLFATVDPRDTSTYIFDSETSYYNDYAKSYFGRTQKKMGWDCLRHYEILANGCMPYFPDLRNCPHRIMTNFPKAAVISSNRLVDTFEPTDVYWNTLQSVFKVARKELSTTALAHYIINALRTLGFEN